MRIIRIIMLSGEKKVDNLNACCANSPSKQHSSGLIGSDESDWGFPVAL